MGGKLRMTAAIENLAAPRHAENFRRLKFAAEFWLELHEILYIPLHEAVHEIRRSRWPKRKYDDPNVELIRRRLKSLSRIQLSVLLLSCHALTIGEIARTLRTNRARCRKILSRLRGALASACH